MKRVLFIILAAMLVTGCAQRSVVNTTGSADSGQGQEESATGANGSAGGTAAAGGTAGGSEEIISEDLPAGGTAGGSSLVSAGREISDVEFADIHFDFDMYDIKPEYRPALIQVSDWLIRNEAVVLIEGHCDDRGTNEYNLALGDRRAKATRDFLMASGVPSRKIEYISYGEERPTCRQQSEPCWARNRRAHFVVGTR